MKKILFAAILLLVLASGLEAQENLSAKLFGTIGGNFLSLSGLNLELETAGYPQLYEDYLSLGFAYQFISGQVIQDFQSDWMLGRSQQSGALESTFKGYSFFYNMGYLLVGADWLHIYPLAGAGVGTLTVTVVDTTEPDFSQMLSSPPVSIRLNKKSLIVQAGLAIDFIIPLGASSSSVPNLILGLRGGYIFQINKSTWQANGVPLEAGPTDGMEGPYIRLMIGFDEMTIAE